MTNTSAVLSWSPAVNGGARPLSEIVYSITAVGECTKHAIIIKRSVYMHEYLPHVSLVCESAESLCVHIYIATLIQSNMFPKTQRMEEE